MALNNNNHNTVQTTTGSKSVQAAKSNEFRKGVGESQNK